MYQMLYIIQFVNKEISLKIGRTSRNAESKEAMVLKRYEELKTALPEDTVIYSVDGAEIFESYLHNFFNIYQQTHVHQYPKLGKELTSIEWFEMPIEYADILVKAFKVRESNNRIEQLEDVEIENLPMFLAGALSAMKYHAQDEGTQAWKEWEHWTKYYQLKEQTLSISPDIPYYSQSSYLPLYSEMFEKVRLTRLELDKLRETLTQKIQLVDMEREELNQESSRIDQTISQNNERYEQHIYELEQINEQLREYPTSYIGIYMWLCLMIFACLITLSSIISIQSVIIIGLILICIYFVFLCLFYLKIKSPKRKMP